MKKVVLFFSVLFGFLLNNNLIAEDVTIGTQKWMPRNLDVTHYRNGDAIRHAVTHEEWIDAGNKKEGAWCYYNNDPLLGAIYGKLYNWYAVNDSRGLAPDGYHVPSDEEWITLTTYLGGDEVAGGKLKETGFEHWLSPNIGASNESGFTGLPSGIRESNGYYQELGYYGGWWSSMEHENDLLIAWNLVINKYNTYSSLTQEFKNYALSVRCMIGENNATKPTLLSPSNFSTNQPRNEVLKWESLSGASEYTLQISTQRHWFYNLLINTTTTNVNYTATNLSNDKTYYWRVRAKKGDTYTQWSEVWSFTTVTGSIDLESGLVAYYPFTGGSTNDFSGNGNHGTKSGATQTTDRFGNSDCAYSFDGIQNITSYSTSLHNENFTYSSWIKLNRYSNDENVGFTIISDYYEGNTGVIFSVNNQGNIQLRLHPDIYDVKSSQKIDLNEWTKVVVIRDGLRSKIFINSNKVADFTQTYVKSPVQILRIGAPSWCSDCQGEDYFFKGVIDDIRIYNRALSDAEVAALYNENVPVANYPYISIDNTDLALNDVLTISGIYFSPNENVNLSITNSSGFNLPVTFKSDATGKFKIEVNIDNSYTDGNYVITSTDERTGIPSNVDFFQVVLPPVLKGLTLEKPISSIPIEKNLTVVFSLSDDMIVREGDVLDNSKTKRKYKYQIEYSKSQENDWKTVANSIIEDDAPINTTIKKSIPVSVSSLQNGVYDFRIKDLCLTTPKYSNEKSYNIESGNETCKFYWDNEISYKDMYQKYTTLNPVGVTADGISRILIKINANNYSDADKIHITLSNGNGDNSTKTLGKITNYHLYKVKGNDEPLVPFEFSISNPLIELWFVAPDEFCNHSNEYDLNQRKITMTYSFYKNGELIEGSENTKDIIVMRPPLMLVHGFNADGKTWDKFKFKKNNNEIEFKNNDKYATYIAELSGSEKSEFNANKFLLIKPLFNNKSSSFYEVICDFRYNNNVVCNRVDYVCHSKGGRDLRKAIETKSGYETSDNYYLGYVNKAIFLDTPHNGSPYADFIIELCKSINIDDKKNPNFKNAMKARQRAENDYNNPKKTSVLKNMSGIFRTPKKEDFVTNWGYLGLANDDELYLHPTEAIIDLSLSEGSKFNESKVKNYFIGSDLFNSNLELTPQQKMNFTNFNFNSNVLIDFFKELCVLSNFKNDNQLTSYYLQSKLDFINYVLYLTQNPGYDFLDYNFLWKSDWIVSLSSQFGGLDYNSSSFNPKRLKKFEGIAHSTPFNAVCESSDVGTYVDKLLNSGLYPEIEFAETIPGYTVTQGIAKQIDKQQNEQEIPELVVLFDSIRINVQFFSDTSAVNIGSLLNFRVNITDTSNFTNLDLYFQSAYYNSEEKSTYYDFSIPVNGNDIENNVLKVYAYFEKPDTMIVSYLRIPINVMFQDTLLSILATPKSNDLNVGLSKTLNYSAIYKTFITNIPVSSPNLSFVFGNSSILELDSTDYSFKGIGEGSTYLIVNYKDKSDTVYFYIDKALPKPDTVPILLYPANNSTNIVLTDTLKWTNPTNTNFLTIEVASDSMFSQLVYTNTIFNDSVSVLNNLGKSQIYYWRVKAVGLGGESDWSEVWSFTTEPDKHQIPLNSGWNLISTYVEPSNTSIPIVWDEVKENVVIVKNNAGATYIPAFDIDDIKNWKSSEGYQVYASQADTLVVTGLQIVPENSPIYLNAGWNIISYLRNSEIDCETAFATITDNGNLIIVKDNFGNTYIPAYDINSIGNLIPGQGYQIYILNPDVLVYPEN